MTLQITWIMSGTIDACTNLALEFVSGFDTIQCLFLIGWFWFGFWSGKSEKFFFVQELYRVSTYRVRICNYESPFSIQ